MLLSDAEILDYVRGGKLIVEGFQQANLTPNGYDLSIGEILIPDRSETYSSGSAKISGNTWFLVGTSEVVELPQEITGQLWIRTSWARKGIIGSFGKVDAGFRGNLTLSAFNASHKDLEINIGSRFAQIVFMKMSRDAERDYGSRSGNYQDQRGVTIEPKKPIR